eukprot:993079-Amphidinium_carterae.1
MYFFALQNVRAHAQLRLHTHAHSLGAWVLSWLCLWEALSCFAAQIVANFYVMQSDAYCDLRPMPSSDKIWCWSALDKSEDSAASKQASSSSSRHQPTCDTRASVFMFVPPPAVIRRSKSTRSLP